ncbi:MAG TPA: NAD(P)H-binding protein [Actinomycetota bacterium]|nr:NAD(P)H-binding protein [Actinomycetota bacterium]
MAGAILVTGASGTIGSRLVGRLHDEGERPIVAGRTPDRLRERWPEAEARALDVLDASTIAPALEDVRVAYYLVHSMEPGAGSFSERDARGAEAFASAARAAGVERIVYLGGLGYDDQPLSEHLRSRQETGRILARHGPPVLEFRAAMVMAADSASFRMLIDLVRRLPAMIVPKWVDTPSQPIGVDDVVAYLAAGRTVPIDEPHLIVEIGGADVVTYRDMIRIAAERTGRSPVIVGVPLLTPSLSSYWTALTTDVSADVARPLIDGMTVPLVLRDPDTARRTFPDIAPMGFREALQRALADEAT